MTICDLIFDDNSFIAKKGDFEIFPCKFRSVVNNAAAETKFAIS